MATAYSWGKLAEGKMLHEQLKWHSKDTDPQNMREDSSSCFTVFIITISFSIFLSSVISNQSWTMKFNNKHNSRIYILPLINGSPCCINVICHQFYFAGVICWIIAQQLQCHVIHHIYIYLPLSYFFWKLLKWKGKKNKE